jgi:hypothetical protein
MLSPPAKPFIRSLPAVPTSESDPLVPSKSALTAASASFVEKAATAATAGTVMHSNAIERIRETLIATSWLVYENVDHLPEWRCESTDKPGDPS